MKVLLPRPSEEEEIFGFTVINGPNLTIKSRGNSFSLSSLLADFEKVLFPAGTMATHHLNI